MRNAVRAAFLMSVILWTTAHAGPVLQRDPKSDERLDDPQRKGETRAAMDYEALSKIDFLPELARLDLEGKAQTIQSLLERSFLHRSGLFYSLLLIDGPDHLRPMARSDMEEISDAVVEGAYADNGATAEAAKEEGMTFENSITSAGNYLQAQVWRYQVTGEPQAHSEALRALGSLRLIYEDGKRRDRAGWLGKPYGLVPKDHSTPDQYCDALLGLYRFRKVAAAAERVMVDEMLRDIADFMTLRNYQIWDLNKPAEADPGNLQEAYCNATYVLAQALAFHVTGEDRCRQEALRLAALSHWREESNLDLWRRQGLKRMLMFERVCLGGYVLKAAEAIQEVLPEVFGATPQQQTATLSNLCERWWRFCQLGMDGDGYQHYWIDIDVAKGTWQPTGIRPNENPPFPGTFGAYYYDVRWSDQLYRIMTGAFTVVECCPELRDSTLAWIVGILEKTNGRRLRWMIDLDGNQLRPDIRWMECVLSSEAPFHYLTAYWRGRKAGWWR